MRFLAAIAIIVPVFAVILVLTRGPRPEPERQRMARHAADSLSRARVAALAGGDVATWGATLRPDALLLGDDSDPVRIGPVEAVDEMRRELGAASAQNLHVERVATGATRRGRLAWAAAALDDRAPGAEGGVPRPRLHTVAYLLRDDEWRVLLETHAPAPGWEELRSGAAARRFPAPAALAASEGREAERLAKRFRRALERFGRVGVDPKAVLVGPSGEIAVGDSAVNSMFADWEERFGEPSLAADGLRASVPRRSGVGCVVANLEVSPPSWGGVTLPLRLTAVYRDRGENSWGLVLAHLSVALPEEGEQAQAAAR